MKIALLGYGRMGKAIEGFALAKGHRIALRINKDNADGLNAEALRQADVAIDFSLPDTARHHIKTSLDAGVPVVSGTTGWTERLPEMKTYCEGKRGTFLYASNFSIGVNIFFALNQKLAEMMDAWPQYDVSLEETHHIHKLDSPSGTGITLVRQIISNLERKTEWGDTASPTPPDTIPIHSRRIGETPGTHSVKYRSPIDTIDIVHTAHSRDGFAKGALLAAEWIIGKTGVFEMKDVLGIDSQAGRRM